MLTLRFISAVERRALRRHLAFTRTYLRCISNPIGISFVLNASRKRDVEKHHIACKGFCIMYVELVFVLLDFHVCHIVAYNSPA